VLAVLAGVVAALAVAQLRGLIAVRDDDPLADDEVVEVSGRVEAPPATVWPLVADHDLYGRLAPGLDRVEVVSEPGEALRRRRTNSQGSSWETCTLWEEGRRFAVEVDTSDYPFPIGRVQGLWQVDPDADGSLVTLRLVARPHATLRGGLTAILLRPVLSRALRRVLGGDGGVDVDVVAGRAAGVQGTDLVRHRVVPRENRTDREVSRRVPSPVDSEFDLRCATSDRIGDRQPGEAAILDDDVDVEAIGSVCIDGCPNGVGERLLGREGGEEVHVLGGTFDQPVGLDRVTTREGEAEVAQDRQPDPSEPFMERVHQAVRAAAARPANRCSQARRSAAGRNRRPHSVRSRAPSSERVSSSDVVASTRTRS
jgi:hypothetical protein